jgi:hypothetical protein
VKNLFCEAKGNEHRVSWNIASVVSFESCKPELSAKSELWIIASRNVGKKAHILKAGEPCQSIKSSFEKWEKYLRGCFLLTNYP